MTDEAQNQPVLSRADRALLDAGASPSDDQLAATRRAIGARIAALAAGAAVTHAASSAQATTATITTAAASAAPAAAASTGFAALGAAKWIGAGLLVTAVASGAVVATRQPQRAERSSQTTASSGAHVSQAALPAIEPSRVESPARISAPADEPAVAPIAPAVKEPSEAPAGAVKRTVQRPQQAGGRKQSEPTARGDGEETLSGELTLLHGARQALARGDASAALQALDAHSARYPNAMLRQEALSARALALCEAGRTVEARRTAAQLARVAPRSPHLIRLADSCALADTADSKE